MGGLAACASGASPRVAGSPSPTVSDALSATQCSALQSAWSKFESVLDSASSWLSSHDSSNSPQTLLSAGAQVVVSQEIDAASALGTSVDQLNPGGGNGHLNMVSAEAKSYARDLTTVQQDLSHGDTTAAKTEVTTSAAFDATWLKNYYSDTTDLCP